MSDQLPTYSNTPAHVNDNPPVMSVGQWFVTLLLLSIPLVNLILLIVWSFSDDTNPNKRNYSRATLIWFFVSMVLSAIFVMIMFAVLGTEAFNLLQQPQPQ